MTLIARLEQADVGSLDLDAEIADAVGIDRAECCGHPNVQCDEGGNPIGQECCGSPQEIEPFPYSTSIDAALTLVPAEIIIGALTGVEFLNGWVWNIGMAPHTREPWYWAQVAKTFNDLENKTIPTPDNANWKSAYHRDKCVALCIAALRARGIE